MRVSKHAGGEPAIAAIELVSIARGFRTADLMTKAAPVRILEATVICPGKYLIVVGGLTDPVREAHKAALDFAAASIVDELFLPNAHPSLQPAMHMASVVREVEAIGIVETFSATAGILGADAACKEADVQLIELRLARGMAGKSFFTFTGALHDVQAGVQAASRIISGNSGLLLTTEVIANPHPDLVARLF